MTNTLDHESAGNNSDSFADEERALATCQAALTWLHRYRDAHDGFFPQQIFNALIRLRPSCSPEVIVHKVVDGEAYFWLTLRAVDAADPFNGMWHYTGTVDRCGDYLIGGIRRVLESELGGSALQSCRQVASIYPVRSRRSDILSVLFLCTVAGEPASAERGRWFSAAEAMRLIPLRKGEDGIVPSHLFGLWLCLRALGQPRECARLEPTPAGARVTGDGGFRQEIVLVESIDVELVGTFVPSSGQ
ncbi:MAG: hypothetical protein AB7U62_16870 [Pseudolabrys sp.]